MSRANFLKMGKGGGGGGVGGPLTQRETVPLEPQELIKATLNLIFRAVDSWRLVFLHVNL